MCRGEETSHGVSRQAATLVAASGGRRQLAFVPIFTRERRNPRRRDTRREDTSTSFFSLSTRFEYHTVAKRTEVLAERGELKKETPATCKEERK